MLKVSGRAGKPARSIGAPSPCRDPLGAARYGHGCSGSFQAEHGSGLRSSRAVHEECCYAVEIGAWEPHWTWHDVGSLCADYGLKHEPGRIKGAQKADGERPESVTTRSLRPPPGAVGASTSGAQRLTSREPPIGARALIFAVSGLTVKAPLPKRQSPCLAHCLSRIVPHRCLVASPEMFPEQIRSGSGMGASKTASRC